ncbi:AMP-dependent synthetase/ligase [Rubricoccus marinus]|uniref:Long-chain fatty acid--CoA ligase n=1 Tax=Rubricoccus marinus TaxID=716817 RepID=A0A259U250_9BACT|nr:long-chain fatty acid--CoA ligase [Rubricoccus marinus]OZC03884.1 long-chain fatty acid--CoA ligase [Rubricoccus marinus]
MPLVVDFDTLPELFDNVTARYAGSDHAALRYKDKASKEWTDITHDALAEQVRAFAGFLHARGVRKGDRVALLSENRPEWAVTDLAVQSLGAVTVALYTTVPASQVAYILEDSGAKVLVVSTGLQLRKADKAHQESASLEVVVSMAEPRKVREALPLATWETAMEEGRAHLDASGEEIAEMGRSVTPENLAVLIYTSGTTGNPKGVELTHENLCSNAKAAHGALDIYEDDIHLSFLPLSHAFERTCGYTAMLGGGTTIAYAESIDSVSKNLPEVQPTILISVPRVFEKIYATIQKSVSDGSLLKRGIFAWAVDTGKAVADRQRRGKSPGVLLGPQYALAQKLVFSALHQKLGGRVRYAVSGGAALPREIGEFFEAAGLSLVEGYGLTETSPILAANPVEAPIYGTVGHVFPGVTVAIRDLQTGHIIGQLTGTEGDTPDLTTGAGEILAKGPNVMRGYWKRPDETAEVFDDEGWFKTGDVGRFEGGYLRITDRIKHMIVSRGGKNIYPGPIEEHFATNPLVEQILVIGEGRSYLTALVVPAEEPLATELKARGASGEEATREIYDGIFREYSKGAASHEKIRDFRFVDEEFSVENELLTPTMKPKRKAIEVRHAALVEEMYGDD